MVEVCEGAPVAVSGMVWCGMVLNEGRIWISFIRIKIYPVGNTAGMSEPNTLLLI